MNIANQCTCTTCWLKPYREEVSGVQFCFLLFFQLHFLFKSSLSAHKHPTNYFVLLFQDDFYLCQFQTAVLVSSSRDSSYAIYVGFCINMLYFKQQHVPVTQFVFLCRVLAVYLLPLFFSVLAGSEKLLVLEQCKSMVVLMDVSSKFSVAILKIFLISTHIMSPCEN